MSMTVKVNVALWSAVIAAVLSVSGILVGVGVFMANQANHRTDIDANANAITSLKSEIKNDIVLIQGQMREDKSELLKAIREIR